MAKDKNPKKGKKSIEREMYEIEKKGGGKLAAQVEKGKKSIKEAKKEIEKKKK